MPTFQNLEKIEGHKNKTGTVLSFLTKKLINHGMLGLSFRKKKFKQKNLI